MTVCLNDVVACWVWLKVCTWQFQLVEIAVFKAVTLSFQRLRMQTSHWSAIKCLAPIRLAIPPSRACSFNSLPGKWESDPFDAVRDPGCQMPCWCHLSQHQAFIHSSLLLFDAGGLGIYSWPDSAWTDAFSVTSGMAGDAGEPCACFLPFTMRLWRQAPTHTHKQTHKQTHTHAMHARMHTQIHTQVRGKGTLIIPCLNTLPLHTAAPGKHTP